MFFNEQPSYSDTANRSSSKLVILLTKFIELSEKLIFGDSTSLFFRGFDTSGLFAEAVYLLLTYLLEFPKEFRLCLRQLATLRVENAIFGLIGIFL